MTHTLCINDIIYAEISVGFERIEELEEAISEQFQKKLCFSLAKRFLNTEKNIKVPNYLRYLIFLLVPMLP